LPMRRAIAVEVLAASGQPALLPEVRKLLADPKPQVRLRAALALVQRGDEMAVAVLIDLLADLPQDERRQAEQALQQLAGAWSPAPSLQGDDELSRKIRREAWAGWWRTMNGPALLAAFRQRSLSEEELARVQALIDQLGDKSFANRDRAVGELIAMGSKVVGLLREAVKSTDLEQATRAEMCLKRITQKEEKDRLPTAAPRLLAVRKPPGAAAALLEYLPFTDDNVMKQEIGKALTSLVLVEGKADPALFKALNDPRPVRQIAAAEALAGGGDATHWPAVRKLLTDTSPEVRLRVAVALVHAHDKESVPALIDLLAVLPRGNAWEAEELLLRLAGAKAPARPSGDDLAARKKLYAAWQAWWKDRGATLDMAELEKTQGGLGLTLVAEVGFQAGKGPAAKGPAKKGGPLNPPQPPAVGGFGGAKAGKKGGGVNPVAAAVAGSDRVVAVDRTGQARWQIENLDHPIDFHLLPGDRVLIAEYNGSRVTERDLKGKILWAVDLPGPPINVQRLANGNTFIALYGSAAQIVNQGQPQMMEVDPAGKTVATFNVGAAQQFLKGPAGGGGGFGGPLNANDLLMQGAYKMADGQIVCLVGYDSCIRMDATGKEVKRFQVPPTKNISLLNSLGNIDVTAKGHIILVQNDSTVTEYDADGKIAWQAKAAGSRATRLPNGNTLVASPMAGVLELDGTGHSVWQYEPPAGYQAVRARRQ
jgi:hypothetical protein